MYVVVYFLTLFPVIEKCLERSGSGNMLKIIYRCRVLGIPCSQRVQTRIGKYSKGQDALLTLLTAPEGKEPVQDSISNTAKLLTSFDASKGLVPGTCINSIAGRFWGQRTLRNWQLSAGSYRSRLMVR